MSKAKSENPSIAVNILITPNQRKALERLKQEKERSFGFLIREAITLYLANGGISTKKKA